jgi:all-trans-retinol dehydrogenase (NAD+)
VCPYYINTGMFDGVRSKIVSILNPDDVVNDVVAGILTNQEQIVIPRWLYGLMVLRM